MKTVLLQIQTLAHLTIRDLLRQNIIYLLLIPALLMISSLTFFAQLNFEQQLKFMRDFCFGTMSFFGVFLAIIATAQSFAQDHQQKTLLPLFAKPIHRWEYLVGKMLGISLLLAGVLFILTLFSIGIFKFQEMTLISLASGVSIPDLNLETIQKYRAQILNPALLIAVGILYLKLLLVVGFTLLLSTVATSSLFTIFCSFMIYGVGHLQSTAREWLASQESASYFIKFVTAFASVIIPDMSFFESTDQILISGTAQIIQLQQPLLYVGINLLWILGLATWMIESREL